MHRPLLKAAIAAVSALALAGALLLSYEVGKRSAPATVQRISTSLTREQADAYFDFGTDAQGRPAFQNVQCSAGVCEWHWLAKNGEWGVAYFSVQPAASTPRNPPIAP